MSDNDSKENKIYSQKEVLSIASKVLGISPQDLVTMTEDKDLSDFDELSSTLKSISVDKRNKLIDSEFKRGFKKSAKQTEKLFRETFVDDDFNDMKQEDIAIYLRDKAASKPSKSDTSKNITFELAMQQQGVKELVASLKQKAEKADSLQGEFESYKGMQYLLKHSLSVLESQGAQFSSNPTIKARQMAALEQELMKVKYKRGEDGLPVILDDDGDSPRLNKTTAEHWNFNDYIQTLSPVDFSTPKENKQNKDIYTPDVNTNKNGNNFGYTKAQQAKFTFADYEREEAAGNTSAMAFIESTILSNAEKEKQNE